MGQILYFPVVRQKIEGGWRWPESRMNPPYHQMFPTLNFLLILISATMFLSFSFNCFFLYHHWFVYNSVNKCKIAICSVPRTDQCNAGPEMGEEERAFSLVLYFYLFQILGNIPEQSAGLSLTYRRCRHRNGEDAKICVSFLHCPLCILQK